MPFAMHQVTATRDSYDNTSTKLSEWRVESLYQTTKNTSFGVERSALGERSVGEPPFLITAAADASSTINQVLNLLNADDFEGSSSDAADICCLEDERDERAMFLRELVKDDLAQFHHDLARLRAASENQSLSSSDEESDWEEEEETDLCFLGLEDISLDVLSSFNNRYPIQME